MMMMLQENRSSSAWYTTEMQNIDGGIEEFNIQIVLQIIWQALDELKISFNKENECFNNVSQIINLLAYHNKHHTLYAKTM